MEVAQAEKTLGYNCYFISMVGSSGSIIEPSISQVCNVKIQAMITDHLIPKIWEEIYSEHLEYDLPQDEGNESDPIAFLQ